jgi:hypothetical protein
MIRGGMTVAVKGWQGIAFNVLSRRGNEAKVVMVGDDRVRTVPATHCTSLAKSKFCGACGQIGCGH